MTHSKRHTVLITGGAGFIGSHLTRRLLQQGCRVRLIDDLSTGRADNVRELLGHDCELIEGRAGQLLQKHSSLLQDVNAVYHLAAAVGVQLVVRDPMAMVRNNVDETAAVLAAAAEQRVPALLASSSEVYGKNPSLPLSEDKDLLYGPTTSPRWSYALSKALDEHMALTYARQGQPIVIVRLFNTIGPRQVGHYGMVVPRFVEKAVAGDELQIYGDGQQTRCFCDVRDVVRAMTQLMDRPDFYGQIYNVGTDRELTIEQLADQVIALAGSNSGKRLVPYAQAYEPGFEDMLRRVPDVSRLRHAIDFVPEYSLQQTLTELIALARAARVKV